MYSNQSLYKKTKEERSVRNKIEGGNSTPPTKPSKLSFDICHQFHHRYYNEIEAGNKKPEEY